MRSRYPAFTLIELLVVIAIIAILAAILFPVFARAREKARQTTCMNNQRQIAIAILMYAQDHDETFPDSAGVWGYVNMPQAALVCPSQNMLTTQYGYVYDNGLAGCCVGDFARPSQEFLTADGMTVTQTNPVNGQPTVPNVAYTTKDLVLNRHGVYMINSYMDGHVALAQCIESELNPLSLASCSSYQVLWVKANELPMGNGSVLQWPDLSPAGNTVYFSGAGAGGTPPILNTALTNYGTISYQYPGLHFPPQLPGTNFNNGWTTATYSRSVGNLGTTLTTANGYTMFTVFDESMGGPGSGENVLYGGGTASGGIGMGLNWGYFRGWSIGTSSPWVAAGYASYYTPSNYRLLEGAMRINPGADQSALWDFWNNGVQTASGYGQGMGIGYLRIGADYQGSWGLIGDIEEVIIYNHALCTADVTTVNNYLINKYGIK